MSSLSLALRGVTCLSLGLLLGACGGGGGGSTPSTSKAAISSLAVSSLALSSSTAPSSLAATSSSAAAVAKCTIDGKQWNTCSTDTGNWGFEAGQYCVSQSFCPAKRTSLPIATLRSAPIDPAANAKTQAIYTYLASIWGQKTLSGQQDLTWKDSIDMAERVHNDTGKYPALMGYDFMNYGMTATWVEGLQQTEEAIA
jgi:mannan endo-1,4-beta-mannosidase